MVTNYYQGSGEPLQPTTVSPRIFKFLKRYVDKLLPHERLVVLSFNEFAFKDYVPINQEGHCISEKLPSHFMVPCIRFVVSKKFHFLGSLFFHSDYLTTKPEKFSKDMSECIKLYILALQNINLKVIATVCPLSAVFHQAVEILTQVPYLEEFDGPLLYSVGKNEEIIHIHDPKYIRDSFIRWFMLFDLKFTLNGKHFEASRYHITDVLEFDNKPPLLQKANNNSKYYHQISYYYFNEQISVTIRRLIKQGFLNAQAIGTSIFINMFRQLFHRIYGLNDEDSEIFDFDRMNDYIEFIKSIHPTQSQYLNEERYKKEVPSDLPTISAHLSKSNLGLTALEQFVRDTPASYCGFYPQKEKSLDLLKQEEMYESIMITTASGKNFMPITTTNPSKKASKSKRKKNKKERKKHNQSYVQQSNQINEVDEVITNTKDDLLLLYQNSSQGIPNNGEFLLCTTKKYEEIQSHNAITSDHTYAHNKNNEGCDKNIWLYSLKPSEVSNNHESMYIVPNNKVNQKCSDRLDFTTQNDKKVLSSVQNISEVNLHQCSSEVKKNLKNVDQNTLHNSNLNENIRQYKNASRNNSGAVRKIDLEDESNKENITKSFLSTISENILDSTTQIMQTLNLDDEINEISYSISDPDDSTEYQFEQVFAVNNRSDEISEEKTFGEEMKMSTLHNNENLSKQTIDFVVQNYLSKEQMKNLMKTESALGNSPKFDSFIHYLKDRNTQYAEMLNEVKKITEPSADYLRENSVKAEETIDIETMSVDYVQPRPLGLLVINHDEQNQALRNTVNLSGLNVPTITDCDNAVEVQIDLSWCNRKPITSYAVDNHIDIQNEQSSGNIQLTHRLKEVSGENMKINLIKISPDGIEKVSGNISEYDPLKINQNTYLNENKYLEKVAVNISHINAHQSSSPMSNRRFIGDQCSTFSKKFYSHSEVDETMDSESSRCDTAKPFFSNVKTCYDKIAERLSADVCYASNMELLASTSINVASYAEKLNNSSNSSSRTSSLQIPRLNNSINSNTCSKRYLQLQDGFSSDSDGDFEIIDRLDKYQDNRITHLKKIQKHVPFQNGQSDKYVLCDFNSEYDDFDDMIINKHVKMIINKLEEKDEQIASVVDKLDVVAPSTSKEHLAKRGFIKKEIIYPVGKNSKSGVAKRTIFHRDKTEELTVTPKNVIKNSENTCDKFKIASTKASYNETLGIKNKKQMAKIKEEQYKKVANTISQTIRRFSNIFNLPDSNENKTLRISNASLDFVYDLKKVNEVVDMKKKQKLLDDAYDRLCLSILGKNAFNPKVQHKMKELMPILQEIAAPKQGISYNEPTKLLSQYINKAIFSKDFPNDISQVGESRYVREDVQNLWINNIKGIERLFKRLSLEKFYFELTPDLFKTEHVEHMMNFIQANGPCIESFPLDERCLPIDLPECFDTLKPCGSTMLIDD